MKNTYLGILIAFIILAVICIFGVVIYYQFVQNPSENNVPQIEIFKGSQPNNFNNPINPVPSIAREDSCINSGGKVLQITCYCSETDDFYNSCLIGGCACTPDPNYARQIKTCECGEGKCFDGEKCVAMNLQ
jgi:hypothetical protein